MAFEGLTEKISATFKKLRGKGRLKESDVKEAMREIRMALLEADVSYKVVKDFTKSVTERCVGSDVLESLTPAQMIVKIVNEELTKLMGSDIKHIRMNPNGPTVVMLVGLQGAGKTTNGSKLAGLMKRQGKNPLLVACDIYRPAAIQQLKVCGEKLGIPVQQAVRTGGSTNGAPIHLSGLGVPVIVIGLPVRYIHTHHCYASLCDFENSVKLAVEIIKRLNADIIKNF